ncbi:MAG: hypothetical protein JO372_22920, partial [Solirubrobacterales bacterium]|nr:hypothetical protein [Solirubrobacterales bacterium]
MAAVPDWGPSHQTDRHGGPNWKLVLWGIVAGGQAVPHDSRTVSTQRTRVLSPGEIANIPAGPSAS